MLSYYIQENSPPSKVFFKMLSFACFQMAREHYLIRPSVQGSGPEVKAVGRSNGERENPKSTSPSLFHVGEAHSSQESVSLGKSHL